MAQAHSVPPFPIHCTPIIAKNPANCNQVGLEYVQLTVALVKIRTKEPSTATCGSHSHTSENFACGEYTHTLRLVSKLPDLRVGYVNSAPQAYACGAEFNLTTGRQNRKAPTMSVLRSLTKPISSTR